MNKMTRKEFLGKVLATYGDGLAKLAGAVIRQHGGWGEFILSAPDIARHGAVAGWNGFLTGWELGCFFACNHRWLFELCEVLQDETGENPLAGMDAGLAEDRLCWLALEWTAARYVDWASQ